MINAELILDAGKRNFDFYLLYKSEGRMYPHRNVIQVCRVWGYGKNRTIKGALDIDDLYHKPVTEENLNTRMMPNTKKITRSCTGENNQFGKEGYCEKCGLEPSRYKYHGNIKKFDSWTDLKRGLVVILKNPRLCKECHDEQLQEDFEYRIGA